MNFRSVKKYPSLHYFRVPKRHRAAYIAFFKTDNINWDRARVCSRHWSNPSLRMNRRGFDVLPDIRLPDAPTAPEYEQSLSSSYDGMPLVKQG